MKPTLTIKQTYHDALFFASSQQNKQAPETGINKNGKPKKKVDKSFFLVANELKVLMKLIHYSTTNENITYQDKDISKHTWIPQQSIINTIKSLKDKGYIINEINKGNDNGNWYCKRIININWKFIESVYKLSQVNTVDLNSNKVEVIQTLVEPEIDSIDEVFPEQFHIAPVEQDEVEIEVEQIKDIIEKFDLVKVLSPFAIDASDEKFDKFVYIIDELKKAKNTTSNEFTFNEIKQFGDWLTGKTNIATLDEIQELKQIIKEFKVPVAA